jgi:hypothetical protein
MNSSGSVSPKIWYVFPGWKRNADVGIECPRFAKYNGIELGNLSKAAK